MTMLSLKCLTQKVPPKMTVVKFLPHVYSWITLSNHFAHSDWNVKQFIFVVFYKCILIFSFMYRKQCFFPPHLTCPLQNSTRQATAPWATDSSQGKLPDCLY